MPKPTVLPVWNTDLTNQTTPSGGKQAEGWTLGEFATSAYDNWWKEKAYRWLAYIDGFLNSNDDLVVGATKNFKHSAAVTRYAFLSGAELTWGPANINSGTHPLGHGNYSGKQLVYVPPTTGVPATFAGKLRLPVGATLVSLKIWVANLDVAAANYSVTVYRCVTDLAAISGDGTTVTQLGATGNVSAAGSSQAWRSATLGGDLTTPADGYISITGNAASNAGGWLVGPVRAEYTHQNLVPAT